MAVTIAALVEETRRLTGTGTLPVEEAVEILRSEMERTLGLIGCARMAEVDARFVGRG